MFARAYSGQNKWIPATVTADDDISMDIIEDNDIDDQGPYFTRSPIEPPARNSTPPPISPPVATPSVPIRRLSRTG